MDGQAVIDTFETSPGPDCLRDIIRKYGVRVKTYKILNGLLHCIPDKQVCLSIYSFVKNISSTLKIQVSDNQRSQGNDTGMLASVEKNVNSEASDRQVSFDASEMSKVPCSSSSNRKERQVCNIMTWLATYKIYPECFPFSLLVPPALLVNQANFRFVYNYVTDFIPTMIILPFYTVAIKFIGIGTR